MAFKGNYKKYLNSQFPSVIPLSVMQRWNLNKRVVSGSFFAICKVLLIYIMDHAVDQLAYTSNFYDLMF